MQKKIVLISGSLRRESYNTMLLKAATELAPAHFNFEWATIDFPIYNADRQDQEILAQVESLKAQIEAADAVLIATPEYNYSIPGGLKNAIDWVSRPAYQSVFRGKKVAIVGVSVSPVGTARALGALKLVLSGMLAEVFPCPEYALGNARDKFDEEKLIDSVSRDKLERLLNDFSVWLQR